MAYTLFLLWVADYSKLTPAAKKEINHGLYGIKISLKAEIYIKNHDLIFNMPSDKQSPKQSIHPFLSNDSYFSTR
jgi:hypothetical protein